MPLIFSLLECKDLLWLSFGCLTIQCCECENICLVNLGHRHFDLKEYIQGITSDVSSSTSEWDLDDKIPDLEFESDIPKEIKALYESCCCCFFKIALNNK